MEQDELYKLLAQPESETLELKESLRNQKDIAQLIIAFANTNGGTIVFGVREEGDIIGIENPEKGKELLQLSAKRISPPVDIKQIFSSFDIASFPL